MRKNIIILFIISSSVIFWFGCSQKKGSENDTPPPLFPQPLTIALNTDTGYRINPITGDSIRPVINSMGDTIKTGVPIAVTGKSIDPSSVEKPKTEPVSWVTEGVSVTNVHAVPDKLTVIPVDESKLQQFILGKDTSSFVLLDDIGDTIPTGVPVPAVAKVVPCKLPKPVEALPMSHNNTNMYRMQHLDAYHGLRASNIVAMLKDRRGNLWVSAIGGYLSCYDGKSFLHFTGKEGMIGTSVFDILEDRSGNIWLSYGVEGITCYDGKNFLNFPGYNKNRDFSGSNAMMADRKGNLWFTSLVNGLTRYDGKTFTHFTRKEGLTSDLAGALLEDSKGNLWIGTNGKGVCRFDGRSFTYFTNKDDPFKNKVNCILEDRNSNLWFGTQGGLVLYDHKNFTWFTENEGLGNNSAYTMYEDKAGDLWISNPGNGVTRYDGKNFIQITEQEGLPSNIVVDIIPDVNGGLWFASDKGISYYDGKFIYYREVAGLPLYRPLSIIVDHMDNLLLGMPYKGLYRYDGRLITHLKEKDSLRYDYYIRALLEDRNGNIWKAHTHSLSRYDGKQLTYFTRKTGLTSDTVFSLLQDSKGNIWMGTRSGLTRYDGNVFLHFTEKDGLISNSVRSVFEDSKNNIWIGTAKGVSKYDGNSFTHYTEREGFNGNSIRYMCEDPKGRLLFGGDKGITCFDGKEFTFISEREVLMSNRISSMQMDSLGNIWVTTNKGLSKIPPGYASNPQLSMDEQTGIISYGLRDELRSEQILTACPDHKNRLWFMENDMAASLTTFDLSYRTNTEKPPSVSLQDVNINDKFIDFRNPDSNDSKKIQFSSVVPFYNYPLNLKLPYYLNQLTFRFIASGRLTEDNIFYSYKLDGLGNDWSNPSTENKARYQYLPPGTYTFKVRAMDRSQIWGELLEYRFTITPPFWQRWWFWFLIGLVSISMVVWLLQKRINTIRKREKEKTESIKRMAELELQSLRAQLNPHFMFNSLNAIQELILMEENEKSQSYLARFSKLLRMLLENAERPFIPLQRELDFLQLYLSLENLRIPDLQFSITIDPGINTEEIFIPNMILQPYIENAIWHGLSHKQGDRKLQIRITKVSGVTRYEIEDNGVGRKKSAELKSLYRKEHKSKGMELLSKRFKLLAKEYGSDIETTVNDVIVKDEIAGTLVTISVPVTFSEKNKTQLL